MSSQYFPTYTGPGDLSKDCSQKYSHIGSIKDCTIFFFDGSPVEDGNAKAFLIGQVLGTSCENNLQSSPL
jgi:hypothetical protein